MEWEIKKKEKEAKKQGGKWTGRGGAGGEVRGKEEKQEKQRVGGVYKRRQAEKKRWKGRKKGESGERGAGGKAEG